MSYNFIAVIARALLEKCTVSNVNIVDRDGRTPLMYACLYGSTALIKDLLQKGSEVNVVDMCGETPLLQCITNMNTSSEMVQCLLNAGADVSS